MIWKFIVTALAFITLTCSALAHDGEDLSGHVTGRVVDQNNAAITGARVVAVRAGTSIKVEATTDAEAVRTIAAEG